MLIQITEVTMQTVTLLTSDTPLGNDFVEKVETLSERLNFQLIPCVGFSQSDFIKATTLGQLQIVDISMDCGDNVFDKIYPIPSSRSFLVSRTYTPLNFRPISEPIWDSKAGTQLRAFPEFGDVLENNDIIAWLERKLPQFLLQSRFKIPFLTQFLGMKKAQDGVYRSTRSEGQIFLSYRSSGVSDIAALARNIYNVHAKTCRYFPPGTLSYEAMSRMRRWNLLSLIDRYLGPAEEIWTCLSDDYFHSWWTYGEFVTATHRRVGGFRGESGPVLRKYQDGKVADWNENLLPQINEQQHKRISHYYSFCDSYQMGPESFITHEQIQQLKLKVAANYYADEVWSRIFWLNPIIECKCCRAQEGGYDEIPLESFLWHRGKNDSESLSIGAEMVARGNGFIELNFDELPNLAIKGVRCQCGNKINITPGPLQYLYVFAPPRYKGDVPVAHQLARKWSLPENFLVGQNLIELPSYLVDIPNYNSTKEPNGTVLMKKNIVSL